MDVSATNFQAAWLDAVLRTQSRQPPVPDRPLQDETLTDMIEAALRAAGIDSLEPGWIDPYAPGQKYTLGQQLDLSV